MSRHWRTLKLTTAQWVTIIAGGIIAILFVAVIISRIWNSILLHKLAHEQSIPFVSVITASIAPTKEEIVLPGYIEAWHEAPIYARTNGYLKAWYVDIGDHVHEGQLLATIETPEIDAQLRQAEADLKVVMANNELAQSTATRWLDLLKTDSVSKQETDEKVNSARALKASLLAARANRDRLQELAGFESVTAPFSGTISARDTDIGALINAQNTANAKPLFRIVQANPLRLYVKIPQSYISGIKKNMTVILRLAEYPGQNFSAKLLKTADAISPKTRTLLAQFIVCNKKNKILPGSYAEVHFSITSSKKVIRIPINAMLFRSEGPQVAIVGKDSHVRLKPIIINRDFGQDIEVKSGIEPGELIIINPPDSITNGEQVQVRQNT